MIRRAFVLAGEVVKKPPGTTAPDGDALNGAVRYAAEFSGSHSCLKLMTVH